MRSGRKEEPEGWRDEKAPRQVSGPRIFSGGACPRRLPKAVPVDVVEIAKPAQ